MFDKQLPTFKVTVAFMLFLIIVQLAASKFGESKHSRHCYFKICSQTFALKFLKFLSTAELKMIVLKYRPFITISYLRRFLRSACL